MFARFAMKSISEFATAPVLEHHTDLLGGNGHPLALYIFSSNKSEIQESEFCSLAALCQIDLLTTKKYLTTSTQVE